MRCEVVQRFRKVRFAGTGRQPEDTISDAVHLREAECRAIHSASVQHALCTGHHRTRHWSKVLRDHLLSAPPRAPSLSPWVCRPASSADAGSPALGDTRMPRQHMTAEGAERPHRLQGAHLRPPGGSRHRVLHANVWVKDASAAPSQPAHCWPWGQSQSFR